MRVTFNTQYRNATEALSEQAAELAARQREISSGRKLHAISDAPTDAASCVGLRTDLAATDQYTRAATSAQSRLQVLDGVLSELGNLVTDAKVAAMSGVGSSAGSTRREAAAQQISGLRDAILSAINTQFGGTYLFAGDESLAAPYEQSGAAVSPYLGGAAAVELDIDRETAVHLTLSGHQVLQGSAAEDLFATLDRLAGDLRAGSEDDVQAGLGSLDQALARIGDAQGQIGLDLAAIESRSRVLDTRRQSTAARLSGLEDADMVESVTALSRADTAYQATLGALGLSQRTSLLDYLS